MKGLGSISIVTSSSKGAFLALCGNCCSWFCIRYSGAAKNFKRGAMMNLQRTKNWSSIANLAFDLLVRDPPQFVLQHPRRRLAPFERPGCCWINLLIVLFYRGRTVGQSIHSAAFNNNSSPLVRWWPDLWHFPLEPDAKLGWHPSPQHPLRHQRVEPVKGEAACG